MAKNQFPVVFSPAGTLAFSYIAKPDTEAPPGASFKPDGKYKGTILLEPDADLADIQARALAAAREQLGEFDESEFHFPWKSGDTRKNEELHGKILFDAKSQFQPECVDSRGTKLPAGVYPKSGDTVRFKVALVPFKKTEKVREKGKMVDVDLFGVSARLYGVQLIKKGAGGGGGWEAVEDGYVADEADAERAEQRQEQAPRERRTVANGDDF